MATSRTAPLVVAITGASAGVGRATARAFAALGARVALIARDTQGLAAARREMESAGGVGLEICVDVSDAESLFAAVAEIEDALGPLDIWVNNAMATVFGPFHEVSPAEFKRVTEVTYLGTVNGTAAALARMRPRGTGTIVQVSSALAYRGIPLQAAYCGAKHAVRGFTESVRCELLHDRSSVRLVLVDLPAVNTPQFDWSRSRMPRKAQPVPPIFQPEVAAEGIVWAALHGVRELRVGGPTTATIVANAIAPGILDRYLARTGYRSQLTEEPETLGKADNLFTPVDRDAGAHGRFDDRAHGRSFQLWLATHRKAVASTAMVAGLLLARRAVGLGGGKPRSP
jgi:NAD(P)-dependent dehydrogenase (short-subunit alcohol dehydrogenase family)